MIKYVEYGEFRLRIGVVKRESMYAVG